MSFVYPAWWLATLASVALLLTGCTSLDHPQGWGSTPEKLLPNGCPDLSGTYDTHATGAYPANARVPPPLDEVLGPGGLSNVYRRNKPWPALPSATTASLTSDGDWLYVRFRDAAGSVAALKFKRKHWWGGSMDGADAMYHCQKLEQGPALGLDGSRRPSFAVPYSFYESDVGFVFLSKDRDGSLIVNYRTIRPSAPVPQIGFYKVDWVGGIWWRYPPVGSKR